MAFADFTFTKFGGSNTAAATLSSVSPIQGIASLDIVGGASPEYWIFAYTAGLVKPCQELKVLYRQTGGSNFQPISICTQLQDAAGAITLSTVGYWASMSDNPFGIAGHLHLSKNTMANGVQGLGAVATGVATYPTIGTVCALGLRVEYDATSGNVYMSLLYDPGPISFPVAADYDFSNMTIIANYLDAVSPYVTGVTFGIAGRPTIISGTEQFFDVLVVDTD